ncbi:MAG: hypothetical protein Q7R41_15265, partial [Phycisphaerales bacterium]|nr:hypothetical protein [Phycisphaerales bacterium]
DVRKNAGEFVVCEKTIKDWYGHFLRSNVKSLRLAEDETKWPDVGLLPCMRAFISIFIALAKKHHMARDHKYRASDQHDVDHYTSAAMAGCLVTSDGKFADTSRLVLWRSFPVIDTEEFLATVKRM